jgi:hypothetical protein
MYQCLKNPIKKVLPKTKVSKTHIFCVTTHPREKTFSPKKRVPVNPYIIIHQSSTKVGLYKHLSFKNIFKKQLPP